MGNKLKIIIVVAIVGTLLLPSANSIVYAQTIPALPGGGCSANSTGPVNGFCTCNSGYVPATLGSGSLACVTPQQAVQNNNLNSTPGWWSVFTAIYQLPATLFGFIGTLLLRLGALILILVGVIFEFVLNQTIVQMATKLGPGQGNIGDAINNAWATLRDIANMVFIFVLLWAAIQTILNLNPGRFASTIRNIIIIALLINFSLFFSKVVIDASNIATVGFYNSIVANAGAKPLTVTGGANSWTMDSGFTTIIMRAAGVESFFGKDILATLNGQDNALILFLTGLLGTLTMIILAIVLLVAAVMFIARFILLVFLMIISPLAFIAYTIPGLSGRFKEWWGMLINQAFFAPLFMLLIWVAMKIITAGFMNVANGEYSTIATNPTGVAPLIFNYAIVIGFIIAALIFSKQMASKTAGFTAIAGAAFATAGFAGRQTVGRAASRATKSQRFQRLAASNPKTFGVLYSGTQKAAKGSFDLRNANVPGNKALFKDLGTAGGTGGFEKYREDKTKAVVEKGKSFTDRQARVEFARRKASKLVAHHGSMPNNVNSVFGMMGRSDRIAAATLFDERIKELQTNIGSARGELQRYLNTMGIRASRNNPLPTINELRTPGSVAHTTVTANMARLNAYEQRRYNDMIATTARDASGMITNVDAIDSMNDELTDLRTDRTGLGLQNTLRQQF